MGDGDLLVGMNEIEERERGMQEGFGKMVVI